MDEKIRHRVGRRGAEKLLNQELLDEFWQEFTAEMNRLRMERRASMSSAKRQVEIDGCGGVQPPVLAAVESCCLTAVR